MMNTAVNISRGTSDPFLAMVGARVRRARLDVGMSRKALAEASGISQRYLAQLESGDGNISIQLLRRVGIALGIPAADFLREHEAPDGEALSLAGLIAAADADKRRAIRALLEPDRANRARRIAFIGLRGAGKSTLGRAVAEAIGLRFVELNQEIEAASGMPVDELIALYGQEGYRRLERQALERVALESEALVLAVAGGIVSEAETFDWLLDHFHTIWLKAQPEEHMARVRAQGDERPMAGNPAAMDELRSILTSREALYARAGAVVDTSGRAVGESLRDALAALARFGLG